MISVATVQLNQQLLYNLVSLYCLLEIKGALAPVAPPFLHPCYLALSNIYSSQHLCYKHALPTWSSKYNFCGSSCVSDLTSCIRDIVASAI